MRLTEYCFTQKSPINEVAMSFSLDTSFNSLSAYGIDLTISDIGSIDDLVMWFDQTLDTLELSEEDLAQLKIDFETEIAGFEELIRAQQNDLETIINSDNADAQLAALAAITYEDLDELDDAIADAYPALEEASEEYLLENITLIEGESATLNSDDYNDGDTITIDSSEAAATGSEFNEDWMYDDARYGEGSVVDGVLEIVDADLDGVADWDVNGDDVIDGDDLVGIEVDLPTVILELEDDIESWSLTTFDDSADPILHTYTFYREDGTSYQMTFIGECEIVCSKHPENLDTMPTDLTKNMRETAESEHSYAYYLEGEEPDAVAPISMYETVDYPDYELALDLTEQQLYDDGATIIIECSEGIEDLVDLTFPNDGELDFSTGDDGQLIITCTNEQGQSITCEVYGIENNSVCTTDADGNTNTSYYGISDKLNINGGIIDDNDLLSLAEMTSELGVTDPASALYGISVSLLTILFHNDEDLFRRYCDKYVLGISETSEDHYENEDSEEA
jgi:hypothetical protein